MRLEVISGPHAGRSVSVPAQLTMGRATGSGLRLDDRTVSRRHATVLLREGGLTVRDEGSLNGTWVNDRRISGPVALRGGDRLRIGGSELLVTDDDAAGELVGAGVQGGDRLGS